MKILLKTWIKLDYRFLASLCFETLKNSTPDQRSIDLKTKVSLKQQPLSCCRNVYFLENETNCINKLDNK